MEPAHLRLRVNQMLHSREQNHALAEVCREGFWCRKDASHQNMPLVLKEWIERLKRLASPKELEEISTELLERIIIVMHDERAIPTAEFAGHCHGGAIGIDGGALVKQISRYLLVIEDNDMQAECTKVYDIA